MESEGRKASGKGSDGRNRGIVCEALEDVDEFLRKDTGGGAT